jgi:hypothetical protein
MTLPFPAYACLQTHADTLGIIAFIVRVIARQKAGDPVTTRLRLGHGLFKPGA